MEISKPYIRALAIQALEDVARLDEEGDERQRVLIFDNCTAQASWIFEDDDALESQVGIVLFSEDEIVPLAEVRRVLDNILRRHGERPGWEAVVTDARFPDLCRSCRNAARYLETRGNSRAERPAGDDL